MDLKDTLNLDEEGDYQQDESMNDNKDSDSTSVDDNNPQKKKKAKLSKEIPKSLNGNSKNKKPPPIFVALHLGAGEHSWAKQDTYKSLCKKACLEAKKILNRGGSAGEAVAAVTVILEDSGILNAGKGSSLTMDKTVECDAGFMNGNGFFGGVGAVPGVPNAILVAKKIADLHEEEPLMSCGRVPPTFLTGEGAKLWAQSQEIPICDNSSLVSKKAVKTYEKYMERLQKASSNRVSSKSICNEVNDTVGAIALDKYGNVASSVSSGGNWLKHSGRVGHAPLFGCGCWASNAAGNAPAIAISCSGAGEMLSKVQLPTKVATIAKTENNISLVKTISSVIQEDFLDNDILKNLKEVKNVGIIALLWDGRRGEFVWGHTAKSFVVAYAGTNVRSFKMDFSTLSSKMETGRSIKVEAQLF